MKKEKRIYYLIYLVFVIFFVAISFMAYHNYNVQKDILKEQFNENQLLLTRQVAGNIEEFIRREGRDFETFTESISVENFSEREILHHLLSFFRLNRQELSTVRIYDKNGTLKYALPSIAYRDKIGKDFSAEPYIRLLKEDYLQKKANLRGASVYTSEVHVDDVGDRVITISRPIIAPKNIKRNIYESNITGIAVITLKLNRIEELFISGVKLSENSLFWALNGRGEIVFYSLEPDMVGRGSEKEFSVNGYAELYKMSLSMLAGESGASAYNYKNGDYYAAYSPVAISDKSFWSIVIATPTNVVQMINKKNFEYNLTIVLLLILLFSISSVIMIKAYRKFMKITLEKEVAEKKRLAEMKYRELFENAANVIFIVSKNKYHIKSYNKCFLNEFNLKSGDIKNLSFLDLLDEENRIRFVTNFKNTLKDENRTYDLKYKAKNSNKYKVLSMTNSIVKGDGDANEVQCIGIDITAQKELSYELIETKNKLQSVFDSMFMGISLISKDFTVLMANMFQAKLFNLLPNDLVGKKCYKVYRKSDAICKSCPAIYSLKEKRSSNTETTIKLKSGKEKCYNLYTYPVYDVKNEVTGFISSVRDITDVKYLESEVLEKSREIGIINNVLAGIAQCSNLEEILAITLEKLLEVSEFTGGVVFLSDEKNKKMIQKAKFGVKRDYIRQILDLWGSEEIISDFIKEKKAITVSNLKENNRVSFDIKTLFNSLEIKQFSLLPIMVKEKLIGAIMLFDKKETVHEGHNVWLLNTISSEVGFAVENSMLCDKISAIASELEKLKGIAVEKEKLEASNELAGVNAHEMTQPLTTILSYSELLMSTTDEASNTYQTLKIINEEANRLLLMTQKIATITKYEVKKYLSKTKVIDIETESTDEN